MENFIFDCPVCGHKVDLYEPTARIVRLKPGVAHIWCYDFLNGDENAEKILVEVIGVSQNKLDTIKFMVL